MASSRASSAAGVHNGSVWMICSGKGGSGRVIKMYVGNFKPKPTSTGQLTAHEQLYDAVMKSGDINARPSILCAGSIKGNGDFCGNSIFNDLNWSSESVRVNDEYKDPEQVDRMREKLKAKLKDTYCGDEKTEMAAALYRKGEYVNI